VEDYAFLADLETAALVHRHGSIDWCCFPRIDSDACLAAISKYLETTRLNDSPDSRGMGIHLRYDTETRFGCRMVLDGTSELPRTSC
jgi:GH15 family glucan-1,4-alpha-glucosidase